MTDLRELGLPGCGDSSCYFQKPKGMSTNGGCRCRPHTYMLAIHLYLKQLAEQQATIERLERQLAEAQDEIRVLKLNLQGRDGDGKLIPAEPFFSDTTAGEPE